MIIYVICAVICFAIAYSMFFVKEKLTQSRKLFGLLALLFGAICIIDFLSQVAGPTKLSVYIQHSLTILYPFPVFLLMLIPRTLCNELMNRTILKIMILPLLVGLFAIIGGGNVIGAEAGNFGNINFVKFIYNETIYSIWLFLNFTPFVMMYYFFYKIYRMLKMEKDEDCLRRLKVFIRALTILVIAAYAFAIAEMIFGTPPLSSVGAAVGVSLAMLAFKLRKEEM